MLHICTRINYTRTRSMKIMKNSIFTYINKCYGMTFPCISYVQGSFSILSLFQCYQYYKFVIKNTQSLFDVLLIAQTISNVLMKYLDTSEVKHFNLNDRFVLLFLWLFTALNLTFFDYVFSFIVNKYKTIVNINYLY